jgi:hypothetical protein
MMWRSMEEPRPENSGCTTADPADSTDWLTPSVLPEQGHNTLLLVFLKSEWQMSLSSRWRDCQVRANRNVIYT